MGVTVIDWDREKLDRLKQAVREFDPENEKRSEHFTFDGNEFVVGYARYLIEYLDGEFSKRKR